ncbi:hypothetical protein GCM10009117_09350 [Gangjinia marincola]|uniref:Secretion system C-terminal sorting domain-containing protein n=1 Tax=Gangjinia marincola TaxID=578463 RepID=A0ABN1MF71_9FLAO
MKKFYLLVFFIQILSINAQTLYVDHSVASSGNGSSWSQAFQTIQEAVDAATPNDEIRIAEGIYQPDDQIDIDIPLTIKGGYPAGGGDQDIDQYVTQLQADANPNNLESTLIRIFPDSPTSIDGIKMQTVETAIFLQSSLSLSQMIFDDVIENAVEISGTIASLSVTNCSFSNAQDEIIDGSSGSAFIGDLLVSNCTFENSSNRALIIKSTVSALIENVEIRNYTDGDNIIQISGPNTTIDNLLAEDNQQVDEIVSCSNTTTITNSVFQNNINDNFGGNSTVCITASGTVNVDNCDFLNNTRTNNANVSKSTSTNEIIRLVDANFIISNSRFQNNIHNTSSSFSRVIGGTGGSNPNRSARIENCEFVSNSNVTDTSAGLIYFNGYLFEFEDNLVQDNSYPISTNNNLIELERVPNASFINNDFIDNSLPDANLIYLNKASLDGFNDSFVLIENNIFTQTDFSTVEIEEFNEVLVQQNTVLANLEFDIKEIGNLLVSDNYIQGNTGGERFMSIESTNTTIENSAFISSSTVGEHEVIYTRGSSNITIKNATFSAIDNEVNVVMRGWPFSGDTPSVSIQNSIFWSNDLSQNSITGTFENYAAENSLIKGENPAGAGNLDGTDANNAPFFINPAEGDFRVFECSPTVNAGNNDFVDFTLDLAGNPRIFDSTVDMGAYENQGIFTCSPPPCTVLLDPMPDSIDIDPNSDLTWESITNADGYTINVGTSPGGSDIVQDELVEDATILELPTLPLSTEIFVQINSFNTFGEAQNCSEFSFTTDNGLSISRPEVLDQLTIYPNPLRDMLHINTPDNIAIAQIDIYDLSGRTIITAINPPAKIDLSSLQTGNYLVRILTNAGSKIQQLIKK